MRLQTGYVAAASGGDPDWYRGLYSFSRDREFIAHEYTCGDLYDLAGGFSRVAGAETGASCPSVCLLTEDRGLMMAALLAALSGSIRLVFPHAFSRQALADFDATLHPDFYFLDDPEQRAVLPAEARVIESSDLSRNHRLPETIADLDEPFLILFTGGSTGTPKVWPKTPRNMFEEARYQADSLGLTAEDLVLSTVPPYHIYGLLFSLLAPFIATARVLNQTYVFPREILKAAEDHRATVLVSNPAHYRSLRMDELQRFGLHTALSSAGPLAPEDAVFFHKKTGLPVTEIFGSTETGGIATRRSPVEGTWHPLAPVDWTIQADDRLCVRSDFLSPKLPRDRNGFFVTSDCVERALDGRFTLRGRADSIVKIGGKRVDMAAVQAALKQIPGVRDAMVLSVPVGGTRQNELAAVVATDLSATSLRRELTHRVENYAIPKRIAVVEAVPITPTGKYDRGRIEKIIIGK